MKQQLLQKRIERLLPVALQQQKLGNICHDLGNVRIPWCGKNRKSAFFGENRRLCRDGGDVFRGEQHDKTRRFFLNRLLDDAVEKFVGAFKTDARHYNDVTADQPFAYARRLRNVWPGHRAIQPAVPRSQLHRSKGIE